MKKILLAIFGAALLMVGCTKEIETAVADVNSRLDALEAQVNANKAAIQALQAAKFVESVTEMPDHAGWTITLSDGTIAIYNGKDGAAGAAGAPGAAGKDGDAFFKSVVIDGDWVIFTLTDDTVITVPYKVVFALELLTEDLAVKPSATVAIPYKLTGATAETKLYAIAGGSYTASVDEAAGMILIQTPAVIDPNSIVIIADRGDGKTAVKAVNLEGEKLTVTPSAVAFYYWDNGDKATIEVVSNTPVTVSTDVPWLKVTQTKATVTSEYTLNVGVSPSCQARTGHVIVKDVAGNVIQSQAVTQTGTPAFFLNNVTGFATWGDASAALASATAQAGGIIDANGGVIVYISQDANLDRIVFPANDAIKSIKIVPRMYGIPAVDPTKVVVNAITVPGAMPTIIENLVIRPQNKEIIADINNGTNGTALLIMPGEVNLTVNNVIFDNSNETWRDQEPTVVYANGTLSGKATFTGCTFTAGVQRFAQVWSATEYEFDGCTFVNDISAYNLRIYDSVKLTVKNSIVDCVGDFVNVRTTDNVVVPGVADGKTVDDTNTYSDRVVNIYTGQKAAVPAAKGGTGIVKLNGIAYPTVTAAIAKAANGATIEIGEGEIDDNIKIPAGKNYTIKAAAGAARDKVIVNGNIEIAGSATISGITMKTKTNVTNNVLSVSSSSDGYAWGHAYLIRLENGAKDVTVENVRFIATEDLYGPGANGDETHFKDGLTQLFIAQSTNVKVLNCIFDSTTDGAYCNNQTYVSDVEFIGNVFNVGGKKTYASRISGNSLVKFSENEFNAKFGLDFYNFTGTLILGDGVEDDNHYTAEVTNALNSAADKYEVLAAGATILPVTVTFNAPTTAPAKDPEIVLLWQHIDDAAWNATVDIANVRNFAMNSNGMYLPQTAGHIYTLSLEDGSVIKDQELTEGTGGHWPGYCGAYSLSDGTIVLASGAINANAHFKVSTYDGENFTPVADFINDGTYRLGDHITAAGTKDDFTVYAVDYKKGSNNTGRYLAFNYKGTALTVPTDSVKISGLPSNANMAEMTPFADGKYYMQLEGGKDDMILTDGADGATAATITLGDLNADVNKRMTRGAKFFSAGGKNYMGFVEFINYDGGNGRGGRVHIYALPTNNPEVDLVGAKAVATYDLPTSTGSGNACASFMVTKVGTKVYLGVGLRSAGVALLEFKY